MQVNYVQEFNYYLGLQYWDIIVFFLKRCWSSGTNNLEDGLNMMFEPVSWKEYQDKQDDCDLFIEVYKEPEKRGRSFSD